MLFAPLHVKSQYSLGLGTSALETIVDRASQCGWSSLALTDLENVYGQLEFHRACRSAGIRALTGVELRSGFARGRSHGAKAGRVVLLAQNSSGFSSLCRIVTRRRARTQPTGEPVLSLENDTEGLFVMTDDPVTLERCATRLGPEVVRALLVRPEPLFSERILKETARRYGIRLAADPDPVFVDPDERSQHRLLLAIHQRHSLSSVDPAAIESSQRSLASPARLQHLYGDEPEATRETVRVAETCTLDLLSGERLAVARDAAPIVADRCKAALERARSCGRALGAGYDARLAEELATIDAMGLAGYFFAASEVVEQARRARVPLAGRGSGVGSLVAHLLGVSPVDPVSHGLYFERFIHPRRHELPDIDLDIASGRRDELIAWVHERFGRERVAQIGTMVRFQRRAAYREGLKALGAGRQEIERFTRRMPSDELLDAGRARVPTHLLPPGREDAVPLIESLVGKPRHISVHPGGVVIAEQDLSSIVALERAPKGVRVTQFDVESTRHMGLVKLDLLGNRCLDEIDETALWLRSHEAESGAEPQHVVGNVPLDDRDTFATIERAATIGCFQLESPAMRSVLAAMPVRTLDDLVAALALVRPGAASGEAKQRFIRRARGLEAPEFWHPAFRERLAVTYGVLLYEEDIIFVLATLGGIDRARADELRAELQERQDDPEWLERTRGILAASAAQQGFSVEVVDAFWREVLKFVQYSFNKAHACSYALLAYEAAYFKTHAPVEFGCALLNHHGGMYPPRALAAELARTGVDVRAPSVQRSAAACRVERAATGGACVRVGLGNVKYVTELTARRLLEQRDRACFSDLADFLERVRPTRPELRALVLSGACDELAPLEPARYPWSHEAILGALEAEPLRRSREALDAAARVTVNRDPARIALYRRLVRVNNELKFLEMHLSEHPMHVLRDEARRYGCLTAVELTERVGEIVRFAGVATATRRVPSRGGGVTQFLTLEDEHGVVEAVIFPDAYFRIERRITTPGPFIATALVREDEGVVSLVIRELIPFHWRADPWMAAS